MANALSIRPRWNRVGVAEPETVAASTSTADPELQAQNLASQPGSAAASVSLTERGTFIGAGAVFDGTLTLKGDFRIDTEFRGELETDGTITVGPQGSVVGDIRAREVVISGAVVGNVFAPRQLVLESTGKLHGDIETACLEIQKHAVFRGTTSMTQPQAIQRMADSDAAGRVPSPGDASRPKPPGAVVASL